VQRLLTTYVTNNFERLTSKPTSELEKLVLYLDKQARR
jgi:hypothetical protein